MAAIRARTVLLVLLASLATSPAALAGGDFVDLAADGSHVWFVGEPGVRELDASTGRTLSAPNVVAPYPLSVALASGAAWIAGVENGFVEGTLSRIDLHTGKVRVVWRTPAGSVQYVAAGAGSVWALIGRAGGAEIARFRPDGRLDGVWKVPGAGRMAADGTGCWISTSTRLLHIDAGGRLHRVLQARLGDVATGAGAVWLPRATSVLRIDERSGAVRTLLTGRLELGGFQHDVAAGAGALWALDDSARSHSVLRRFDLETGRGTGSVSVPGIADAVVATRRIVWVATVIAPPSSVAIGFDLIRIDPRTLHRTLLVRVA
ncbi:MAG: hypothetical protein ACRDM1_08320 [Gaiellaceae bacterium]